jgi:hypothetical protein
MAMDPKQERVLRDGTASPADRPRRIDRESVRAQAENPPIAQRPTSSRRTAAVGDIRVNLPSGTPVEELSRAAGAERVPELGVRSDRDEAERDQSPAESVAPEPETRDHPAVRSGEARRALKARREHSKGDGNFPSPERRADDLIQERPEDRSPRDVPKARDDRSAPKGNVTTGQADRNAGLEVRDEYVEPRDNALDSRARGEARGAAWPTPPAAREKSATRKKSRAAVGRGRQSSRSPSSSQSRPKATSKRRSTAKAASPTGRKTKGSPSPTGQRGRGARRASGSRSRSPQAKAAAARGTRKPVTKRSLRQTGPRPGSGSTRGGKR